MKRVFFSLVVISLLLSACGALAPATQADSKPVAAVTSSVAISATATPIQPTVTASITGTPDPYEKYTIPYLRSRTYGGGQVQLVGNPSHYSNFTRYLITYPSDGITIAGFMDVPNGLGPFPVIIALHGYIDPLQYTTLDYTTRYADALATSGYLVLHPNMRNFPPSGQGDDLFRVGMAIDVLNLIAIVKATGGQNGALDAADPQRIGLWGHSMGGGIATRVLTVSPDVKAALLYSPVSGDDLKNYAAMAIWSNNKRGDQERAVPPGEFPLISPMFFYQYVQAAVSIHQGMADTTVPVQWSRATCDQLQEMGKTVECHYYDGQGHIFAGNPDKTFMRYASEFFDTYLRRP
jgi:dipeptidyl aminopeptidase/acylaminoacyl peptidase